MTRLAKRSPASLLLASVTATLLLVCTALAGVNNLTSVGTYDSQQVGAMTFCSPSFQGNVDMALATSTVEDLLLYVDDEEQDTHVTHLEARQGDPTIWDYSGHGDAWCDEFQHDVYTWVEMADNTTNPPTPYCDDSDVLTWDPEWDRAAEFRPSEVSHLWGPFGLWEHFNAFRTRM